MLVCGESPQKVAKLNLGRVLFVRPPLVFDRRIGHEGPHPPLESLYLAALLEPRYDVGLLDGMTHIGQVEQIGRFIDRAGMSDGQLADGIRAFKPDVVCLSSMWVNQKSSLERTADLVKSVSSDIVTIAGGLLPSSLPQEISARPSIDYVIAGEGEVALPHLLQGLAGGKVEPLSGIHSRCVEAPPERSAAMAPSLDALPSPAYHLVDFNEYRSPFEGGQVKNFPYIGVLPTRGCTYACSFCSLPNVTARTFRRLSVERVIADMELLKGQYGIKEFHFYDANLLNDPAYAKDLFRAMIAARIQVPWLSEAGLAIWELNREILDLAVESGMYRLDLPIESGSKKVRKEIMNKDLFDRDGVASVIRMARAAGIERIQGYVMLGNPGEDRKTMQETLDTLNRLDLDYKGVRFAQPFPNTKFYDTCLENGFLVDGFSYDGLWFTKPQIQTDQFNIPQLLSTVQSDRALALKRLGRQGLFSSIRQIFRGWGIGVGLRSLIKIPQLSLHYRSIDIPAPRAAVRKEQQA
jgi:radical SAM superfamily enzyme YgiQ (UPF0313 family)